MTTKFSQNLHSNSVLLIILITILTIATTPSSCQTTESTSTTITTTTQSTTDELSLECTFSDALWFYFNRQYTCTVKSNLKVLKSDTTIVAVDGECGSGKVISNVSFFYVLLRTVYYIPKGLDVLLPGLTGLKFENTKLKHVTKQNLQPFTNLVMFSSVFNEIQFIEKDLFAYNTKLQFVSFRNNKIAYIDPLVFDVVGASLVHLWLDGTTTRCGLNGVTSNANVLKTITKLKASQCANEENAPALYQFWLQQQGSSGDCAAELAAKDAEIERINVDLVTLQEDYDALSGEVTTLTAEVLVKDQECQDEIKVVQDEYAKTIGCLLNPTAECPTLRAIRRAYGF
jgi:hypothetical protein